MKKLTDCDKNKRKKVNEIASFESIKLKELIVSQTIEYIISGTLLVVGAYLINKGINIDKEYLDPYLYNVNDIKSLKETSFVFGGLSLSTGATLTIITIMKHKLRREYINYLKFKRNKLYNEYLENENNVKTLEKSMD